MGKSKGGKYFKPPRNRAKGANQGGDDSDEEEEEVPQQRGPGAQRANVGMLPPSESEGEEEEGGGEPGTSKPAAKAEEGGAPGPSSKPAAAPKPKNANAGELPPNSDDEEDEDDDDEESSEDDQPVNDYLSAPRQRKPAQTAPERDAETIRKDLERLQLIRKKREEDRLKRIQDEGWDRFAPVSDTNRPPGSIPSDHPSLTGKH